MVVSEMMLREQDRERGRRYRKRHGNGRIVLWKKEHPEETKLIGRRWYYNHIEKAKENTIAWRKQNPDKVRLQNKRAKKRLRERERRRLAASGIRQKMSMECIPGKRGSLCKTCGREIPFIGKHTPKKYCDSCFPQIMALKRVLGMMRFKEKNKGHYKKWYAGSIEKIVAVTCIFCDDIIPGNGGKLICESCKSKWGRKTPATVEFALSSHPSFTEMPKDLLIWKKIIELKKEGIMRI